MNKICFILFLSVVNVSANNLYFKNCQICHGHSQNKSPLSFEKISTDFVPHEFTSYLKYAKNKSSVHNNLIENKMYSKDIINKMINVGKLNYEQRKNITDFIYDKENYHVCMW